MKIKNILKVASLILLAVFFTSCNDDDNKQPSYPEIKGIENQITLISGESVSFDLMGGDGNFTAKTSNSAIANAEVKDKMLIITAGESTGMAEITLKSADKVKVIKVNVADTPEDGIYMGAEKKVGFSSSVKNSKGLWLIEKTGNPYKGARIFIPVLPQNLEKNQEIQTAIRTFGIDGMEGTISKAMVEVVTNSIVKLKIENYSIVISKK